MPEVPYAPTARSWSHQRDDVFSLVTTDVDGHEVRIPLVDVDKTWHMTSDHPGVWPGGVICVRGARVERADRSDGVDLADLSEASPGLRLYHVEPS